MSRKESQPKQAGVDPATLRALGSLVVNFNSIEEMLEFSISGLLGCEYRRGLCLTAQLSFQGLINAFCSLFYLRAANEPETVASVQKLRVRLQALEQRRNELLHSDWMPGLRPGFSARAKATAKAKRGLVTRFVHISPATINRIAHEMAALSDEVFDLFFTFAQRHGEVGEIEDVQGAPLLEPVPEDEARALLLDFFEEER